MAERTLRVSLYGQPAAWILERVREGRPVYQLQFDEAWVLESPRPVLTLKALSWSLHRHRVFRERLPPFLTNLLFERSAQRQRVAREARCDPGDDVALLLALGHDLSGAIHVELEAAGAPSRAVRPPGGVVVEPAQPAPARDGPLRWSLAGMQPKWSADVEGRLTLAVSGAGGRWILKLPPPGMPDGARAELAALEWARLLGFEVPEARLVPAAEVQGLPLGQQDQEALLVRRFDRREDRSPIHMEELASVLGLHPEQKYHDPDGVPQTNLVEVGRLFARLGGPTSLRTFFRRVLLDVLVGNGDAHLKNWAFLFPDRVRGLIAPVYDVFPTLLHPQLCKARTLALPFTSERGFTAVTRSALRSFAEKVAVAPAELEELAHRTVTEALRTLPEATERAGLAPHHIQTLHDHLRTLPLATQLG